MPLTDEDIQKIVAAVETTDWAQFAISQMQSAQAKGDETPVETPEQPAGDMGGTPPAEEPPVDPAPEPAPKVEEEKPPVTQNANSRAEVARYQRISDENAALKKRLDAMEAENVRTKRYARIDTLASEHVLDQGEEYKRADGMNEQQFADFYGEKGVVVSHYQKIPVDRPFIPVAGPKQHPAGATTEDQKERAIARVTQYQRENPGKRMSFDEALAEVKKGVA